MNKLKDKKGQTAVEYLLLLGATFIASYLMVTGPMANFTREMLLTITAGINNVVQFGEWEARPNDTPADPERLRPLHL